MSSFGDAPVASTVGKVDDGVQLNGGKMMVWTTESIVSRRGTERRLELLWAPVSFGHGRTA
jgi:hypothetical protein